MRRVCSWCSKDLGGDGDEITHTICPECEEKMLRDARKILTTETPHDTFNE
jgi:DNA-directed RNA polymerase subunit RPC12/RpoP